ncbi:hypothetical protein [Streptomyces sp. NPDC050704]|uniref:hypothetical protein n=1 Tax=Streptomyces sp. NPDC050704 TaxID=3157219 RepID=UPI00341ED855
MTEQPRAHSDDITPLPAARLHEAAVNSSRKDGHGHPALSTQTATAPAQSGDATPHSPREDPRPTRTARQSAADPCATAPTLPATPAGPAPA